MSLLVPELELVNTLNMILNVLRDDYQTNEDNGTTSRSLLYLLFGNVSLGTYDFFQNAKELILTTPQNPKHIEVKLSYDHDSQQSAPVIWVTLPSENNRNNSLGIGEGNQVELLYNNTPEQDTYRKQYNYRWGTTYQVVVGAQGKNEAVIIYHLIKAMIVASITHLELQGFSNLKIGGGDIRLHGIPDRFFTKAITLNFEYEQTIPFILTGAVYRTLRLFYKPEGAEVATGPIEISVEDDISDSSSS